MKMTAFQPKGEPPSYRHGLPVSKAQGGESAGWAVDGI